LSNSRFHAKNRRKGGEIIAKMLIALKKKRPNMGSYLRPGVLPGNAKAPLETGSLENAEPSV
jgi:hypothetical protein